MSEAIAEEVKARFSVNNVDFTLKFHLFVLFLQNQ